MPPSHGERLGVVPAAALQRPAVRSEDRRHLGVGDRDRGLAAIDDAPAQPVALVGDRKEMLAVGRDAQARQAAEIAMRRIPGSTRRGIPARRSACAPARAGRTPRSPGRGSRSAGCRSAARGACAAAGISASARMASKAEPRDRKLFKANPLNGAVYLMRRRPPRARLDPTIQECSLRAERRAGRPRMSSAACSSNSSASFSVIAPPSSSASTMVTARR